MRKDGEMKSQFYYEGLLLIQCFFWGSGNPIGKIGLSEFSPFSLLALRFLLASLFFLLLYRQHIQRTFHLADIVPCMLIGFFTFLSFSSSIVALLYTSAIKVGFLICVAIIFVPFLARYVLGTKIRLIVFVPILLVLVGLYYFCDVDGVFYFGMGERLALLGAASGACMLVFSSKYLRNIDPVVVSFTQTAFTGGMCLLIAVCTEDLRALSAVSYKGWSTIFYMSFFCTNVAYMIQNTALKHISTVIVALLCTTEPIFTAVTSYFLLGETLGQKGFIGAVLIIAGIVFASLRPVGDI